MLMCGMQLLLLLFMTFVEFSSFPFEWAGPSAWLLTLREFEKGRSSHFFDYVTKDCSFLLFCAGACLASHLDGVNSHAVRCLWKGPVASKGGLQPAAHEEQPASTGSCPHHTNVSLEVDRSLKPSEDLHHRPWPDNGVKSLSQTPEITYVRC